MEITMSNLTLFAVTLCFGLVAGLCFTWGNAVTPGIGQLDDLNYLNAFQKMNRSIENPLFFTVFIGSFFMGIATIFANKGIYTAHFWMITIAVAIYFFGLIMVTIMGNVPLNQILDKTDLLQSSAEELKTLREKFENPWNRFHTIRMVSTTISFALLIIAGISK